MGFELTNENPSEKEKKHQMPHFKYAKHFHEQNGTKVKRAVRFGRFPRCLCTVACLCAVQCVFPFQKRLQAEHFIVQLLFEQLHFDSSYFRVKLLFGLHFPIRLCACWLLVLLRKIVRFKPTTKWRTVNYSLVSLIKTTVFHFNCSLNSYFAFEIQK